MTEFYLDTTYPSSLPFYFPIEDTFDRADSNAPGVTPGGRLPWVLEAQSGDVSNWRANIIDGQLNVARTSAPATSIRSFAVVDTPFTDYLVECVVATLPGSNRPMVVTKYVDPDNYIAAYIDGAGNWSLVARNAGAGTVLPGSIKAAPGQRLRIQHRGANIWLYVNDISSIPSTSFNHHVASKRCGVGVLADSSNAGTSSRFDSFKVRELR